MDWEKLIMLSGLVDDLIGDDEPSDEDLDYDEDAIAVYDCLHDLKMALRNFGLQMKGWFGECFVTNILIMRMSSVSFATKTI